MQLAKRTLACSKGERYVTTGYKVCFDARGRPRLYDHDMIGLYIHFKTSRSGWQLAKVVMVAEDAESKELPHDQTSGPWKTQQRPPVGEKAHGYHATTSTCRSRSS